MKTNDTETPTAPKNSGKEEAGYQQQWKRRHSSSDRDSHPIDEGRIKHIATQIAAHELLSCQTKLLHELIDGDSVDGFDWEHTTVPLDLPVDILTIVEWWLVTPWLASRLGDIGELVIANEYGQWWGSRHARVGSYDSGSLEAVVRYISEIEPALRRLSEDNNEDGAV